MSCWPGRRTGLVRRSTCCSCTASASCRCRSGPARTAAIDGIVGSVSERQGLLEQAYRDPSVVERTIGEVMDPPLPAVDVGASLDDAFALLSGGAPAVVATKGTQAGRRCHQAVLLEFLAHRGPRAD